MPPQNARPKPPHAAVEKSALVSAEGLLKRERKGAKIALAGALPPAQIPPEALASPRHDRLLATALAVSIALHLTAAAIHFSPFDFSRLVDKEPPLEVAARVSFVRVTSAAGDSAAVDTVGRERSCHRA